MAQGVTTGLYPDPGSQSDGIVLQLPDSGQQITKFLSYAFDSDFLSPADGFHFELGGTEATLTPQLMEGIYAGAKVLFQINGRTQGGGYIDAIESDHSHSGGTVVRVHGRDVFGAVVDAGADPTLFTFQPGMTLEQAVRAVFAPFGFTQDSQFQISNDANRTLMTGVRTTTKKGKPLKARAIAKQIHPYPAEGLFAYLTRFLHRFGLWCWPSADQTQVIVDEPSYDSALAYGIVRKADGSVCNVESGGIHEDATDQPAAILATGFSGGDPNGRSRFKVLQINELTGLAVDRTSASTELIPTPAMLSLIARNKDAKLLDLRSEFSAYLGTLAREDPQSRMMFLHDDESKSLDQLEAFVRREMSLRQRRMWTGRYMVMGHTQNGRPWAVDTMCGVVDDFPPGRPFNGSMWVSGRCFHKARRGHGTTTEVRLSLPHTLNFSGGD